MQGRATAANEGPPRLPRPVYGWPLVALRLLAVAFALAGAIAPRSGLAAPFPVDDSPDRASRRPPDRAIAAIPGCAGQVVGDLQVEGCEGFPCGQPDVLQALARAVVGAVGDRARPLDVRHGIAVIQETGLAHSVRARCEPATTSDQRGAVRVVFAIEPASLIREISISGSGHFYPDEIQKRLFLREGASLAPETTQGQEQIARQRETLLFAYERAGVVGTQIDIRTESMGPGLLRLVVDIEEGVRNRIDSYAIRTHPPGSDAADQPAAAADDPAWGCHNFSESDIADAAGLADAEVYTERAARDIRGLLREALQRYGWVRPTVQLAYDLESATLSVDVRAESCYLVKFRVREGGESRSQSHRFVDRVDWRNLLSFGTTGAFDFEEADYNRRILQADLERSGLLFASVVLDYRRLHEFNRDLVDGRTIPETVRGIATYDVTLGNIIEIRSIEYPGMSPHAKDRFVERLETRAYDFFGSGGYLRTEQLMADLEQLRQLYRDAGYPQMQFVLQSEVPELTRSVTRGRGRTRYTFVAGDVGFAATKPDGENIVYVEVPIREGEQARVERLSLVGCADPATCERVRAELGVPIGAPFSPADYKTWLRALRTQFADDGYGLASVKTACHIVTDAAEPDWPPCDPETTDATRIALEFQVVPGPRFSTGEWLVVGDFETSRDVILRDLPPQDDWLRTSSVLEAERRLRNLGIFNSVNITPLATNRVTTETARIPLLVRIEERPYQFLDLAVGFESFNRASLSQGSSSGRMPPAASSVAEHGVQGIDRISQVTAPAIPLNLPDLLLVSQAEYVNLNLAGSAQELRVPFKYGVSTGDPARLLATAPTLLNRRFFGTDILFRTTLYSIFDRANYPFDRVEGGLELELSQQLWQQLFVSGRYAVSATSTRSLPTSSDPDPSFSSPLLLNKPEIRLTWDRQDTPTHPTEGFALTGRIAYLNSLNLSSRDLDNFVKWGLEGRYIFNIKKTLVFANFARISGSVEFSGNANADLPVNERYYLGGNKGIRGFEDGEISQYDKDGRPLDADPTTDEIDRILGADFAINGTTELRFPLGFSIGPLDAWGAGFVDWGGLADSLSDFHNKSIRVTAGGGIRLLLYGRVPVRIDYGVKLDRRCRIYAGDGCERLEDVGELEFNILYTF